jgi:hypothetical protein
VETTLLEERTVTVRRKYLSESQFEDLLRKVVGSGRAT